MCAPSTFILILVYFLNIQSSVFNALPDAGSTFIGRPGLSEFLNSLWRNLRSHANVANDQKVFLHQQLQQWKSGEKGSFIQPLPSLGTFPNLPTLPISVPSSRSHSSSIASPVPPSESGFSDSTEVSLARVARKQTVSF